MHMGASRCLFGPFFLFYIALSYHTFLHCVLFCSIPISFILFCSIPFCSILLWIILFYLVPLYSDFILLWPIPFCYMYILFKLCSVLPCSVFLLHLAIKNLAAASRYKQNNYCQPQCEI